MVSGRFAFSACSFSFSRLIWFHACFRIVKQVPWTFALLNFYD
jgi:hypothetical protein